MIKSLKQMALTLFVFASSTTIVFAGPGMSNYFNDHKQVSKDMELMQQQEDKFIQMLTQGRASNSSSADKKGQLISKLDKAIAQAESKNESPKESMVRIGARLDKYSKDNQANVTAILKDQARFDRIYFALNKQGQNVSRAELKQQLLNARSPQFMAEMKTKIEQMLMHSGSIANMLKDLKQAVENEDFTSLAQNKSKIGRSVASIHPAEVMLWTLLIVCVLSGGVGAALPIFMYLPAVFYPLGVFAGIAGGVTGFLVYSGTVEIIDFVLF